MVDSHPIVQEKKNTQPCRYICMLFFIWKQMLGIFTTTPSLWLPGNTFNISYNNLLISCSCWQLVCSFLDLSLIVFSCILLCLKQGVFGEKGTHPSAGVAAGNASNISFTHSFIHSFVCSFVHLSVHPPTHSFLSCFIWPLNLTALPNNV